MSEILEVGWKRTNVKKGHPEESGRNKCTEPFQSSSQSIIESVLASGGNNRQNSQTLQNIIFAVSSGQEWSGRPFQDYFSGDEYYRGRKARSIYDKYGIEKAENYLNSNMETSKASEWVEHSFLRGRQYSNP